MKKIIEGKEYELVDKLYSKEYISACSQCAFKNINKCREITDSICARSNNISKYWILTAPKL